jgi:hypothetical protein
MHFFPQRAIQSQVIQSQVARAGLLFSCLAIAALTACSPSSPSVNAVSGDSSTVEASPEAHLTADSTAKSAAAKGSAKDQFTAIIGTLQDGWTPQVLVGKGLKQGLTPTAAGKIIPGAEKVSQYGFSKVKVENVPGLKEYEFYYAQNASSKTLELKSVRLKFDPALNEAYPDLVKVASAKYGPAKPEDVKNQIISWVGPEFITAQITKPPLAMSGYELNVDLEK